MTSTWKPLGESLKELARSLNDPSWNQNRRLRYDHATGKWRAVPCSEDERQSEDAARRRDAREGFDA